MKSTTIQNRRVTQTSESPENREKKGRRREKNNYVKLTTQKRKQKRKKLAHDKLERGTQAAYENEPPDCPN